MLKSIILFSLIVLCTNLQAQTDPVGSGRAIKFDGVDDYIDLGNRYDNLTLPVTVSAWVYLDSSVPTPGGAIFVTQDNDPNIYNGIWLSISSTAIIFEYGDGFGSNHSMYRKGKLATVSNMTGRWVNICAILRSATSADIYVNGSNVGGSPSGDSNFPMASNFPNDVAKIGLMRSNAVEYFFEGLMDEVRFFNRALTETEIRNLMCKKLTGNEEGLIGYWNFDETTGNVINDKSPNGFHGQLKNNPTRVYSGAPIGDESIFAYQSNWTGTVLTETEGSEKVEVSKINGAPEGVHIYTVKSTPSQTSGLDVLSVPNTYFGVFTAASDFNNSFDVKHTNDNGTCGLSVRANNSISTWTSTTSFVQAVNERTELIQQTSPSNLTINLGPDEEICPFVSRTLKPLNDPTGYTFTWHDGSKQSTFQANDYGTFWVMVENGCVIESDTISFSKPIHGEVFIPNVITSNDDEFNQYFIIDDLLRDSQLYIFNRWGKRVFFSANYKNDWDGSELPSGVYYYFIKNPCIEDKRGPLSIIH